MKKNISNKLHRIRKAVTTILNTLNPTVRATAKWEWRIKSDYNFESREAGVSVFLHVMFGQHTGSLEKPPEPLRSALRPINREWEIKRVHREIDTLIDRGKWINGGGESDDWYCKRVIGFSVLFSELPRSVAQQRKKLEKRWESLQGARKTILRAYTPVAQKLRSFQLDRARYANTLQQWVAEVERTKTQVVEMLATARTDTFTADMEKYKIEVAEALGFIPTDELVWETAV